MDDAERRLVMLVQANDKCPVEEWLDGVRDKVTRARVIRQIDKLSRGLGVQKGLQGVAELKIDIGPGYRVYYAFLDQKTLVVLIGGGDKSSQSRDIAQARRLWAEFEKAVVPWPLCGRGRKRRQRALRKRNHETEGLRRAPPPGAS